MNCKTCPTCGHAMPGLPLGRRGRPPVRHPSCARAFENQREADRMRRNRAEGDFSRIDMLRQIRLLFYQEPMSPVEIMILSEECK
jgi:hypothetical protein